ncbi:hypothetical protein [Thiothrix nivea]|uniref:Uncharacterized protein n=1 Tax=Thiothrix nivea (strain ATCC 35100 / DSM 5205 / JP2) TaxID=870187 RepID=A0A656HPR6_THINJ|nr:hypothetical protein [Thiothrix nivea]EIJ37065.1 hypothetical protein Thini_0056 [Thiothrix nivea DSM 5205]
MIKTNVATCPHCGAVSRRQCLAWWQCLLSMASRRLHYRCTACKQGFWSIG